MICLQNMSGVQVNTLSYDLGKETLQAPWVQTETIRNGAETGQKYGPFLPRKWAVGKMGGIKIEANMGTATTTWSFRQLGK